MSRLVLDPYHLRPLPAGALEVTDLASYLAARRQLLRAVRFPAAAVPIVVRAGYWQHWFGDVPEWVEIVSPRRELQARHPAHPLPPALDDAAVLALDLLHRPGVVPTAEGLRQHFFPGLSLPAPASPTAADLFQLATFASANAQQLTQPYLQAEWATALVALPPVLAPLRAADVPFARLLAEGIYVSALPAAAAEWAHEHRTVLATRHGIDLAALAPLLRWTVPPFGPAAIETGWEQGLQKTIEAGLRAVPAPLRPLRQAALLPGHYRAEVLALLALGIVLDAPTLVALEQHYGPLLATDTTSLRERLRALVPPVLLPSPVPAALSALPLPDQFQCWQEWATTSFIPYKFWLDQLTDRPEAAITAVEEMADAYGDWLFQHYAALLSHGGILTNRSVRGRIADLLATPNSRVLWLIIDGFPTAYLPLLREALRRHGLSEVRSDYVLAPLPTITEIGIPALLNGLRPDDPAFTSDREDALRRAFPLPKSVAFTAAVGRFAEALATSADLCCLHWWELDAYQHKPQHHIKGTRTDYIRRELHEYIGELADELRRLPDRATHLVISTDHGATRCLRDRSGIKNRKINEAATAKHERCVKLEGKLLNEAEHLDPQETYFLPSSLTHNPDPWVVARGYRYFGSNDAGYRHGGLTPEETIVPLVVAKLGTLALKPLRLTYPETRPLVLGSTLTDAAFVLENPNDFTVQLRELHLLEDAKATLPLTAVLAPRARLPLALSFKLPRNLPVAGGQVVLTAEIRYVVQAEEHTDRIPVTIILPVNELDDLFGDL
jgi:hypothetical protein